MAEENPTRLDDVDHVNRELDRVHAVIHMLTHNFGGDSNTNEPANTPGLPGLIQYCARVLREIKEKLMQMGSANENVGEADLLVIEASGLADLIEHLSFGVGTGRFDDRWMCSYFDAIDGCVERAIKTFQAAVGLQAPAAAS